MDFTVFPDNKGTQKQKVYTGSDDALHYPADSSLPHVTSCNVSRPSMPLSERQQMALLLHMRDDPLQNGECGNVRHLALLWKSAPDLHLLWMLLCLSLLVLCCLSVVCIYFKFVKFFIF